MAAIRPLYETYGVDGYYRDHAEAYKNPHFAEIEQLLKRNIQQINTSGTILDFAAGGGEVTQILTKLGIENLLGCDPYTQQLYQKQTDRECIPLSFKQVIKEGLPGAYSTIICSFALHLCPTKELFSLCWNLFRAAPLLLVLSPHKRPELDKLPGVKLLWEDFALTERGKKVRCKAYQSSYQ